MYEISHNMVTKRCEKIVCDYGWNRLQKKKKKNRKKKKSAYYIFVVCHKYVLSPKFKA